MFGIRFVKSTAIGLASLGMIVPQVSLLADMPQAKTPANKESQVKRIPDLILTDGGTMTGRVCDHSGKVIEGADVILKQNNKEIGKAVTNKEGIYSFKNVKSGVYRIGSGNTEGIFRTWSEKTAPPSAKQHALLVLGENGARGQFGSVDPTLLILTGGVIAAAALSAVALNKVDSLNSTVNTLTTPHVSP